MMEEAVAQLSDQENIPSYYPTVGSYWKSKRDHPSWRLRVTKIDNTIIHYDILDPESKSNDDIIARDANYVEEFLHGLVEYNKDEV